jgi:hypothetical protein
MGTRCAHEHRCSRNEPLDYHCGCERAIASPTEAAARDPLNKEQHVRSKTVSSRWMCRVSLSAQVADAVVATWRIVGKQEVKQSARVRADYYISCAFGLRSVGFVREGTPGAKVH